MKINYVVKNWDTSKYFTGLLRNNWSRDLGEALKASSITELNSILHLPEHSEELEHISFLIIETILVND